MYDPGRLNGLLAGVVHESQYLSLVVLLTSTCGFHDYCVYFCSRWQEGERAWSSHMEVFNEPVV